MKYKVTTTLLTGAGDTCHRDEWLFDTREEAQDFVDDFHKAFPKGSFCMDYPYIYSSKWSPEIEEVDDTRADPYKWLDEQIKKKKAHIKKYGR